MHRTRLVLLAALVLACGGCAKKKIARAPLAPRIGDTETGIASWYGEPYHGRRAANGEIYDMEKMTAAHKTLPFGTWVRVDNLDSRKAVDVRIQYRGPFIERRIIDLSRAAAREVDMIGPGIAKVRLTVIAPPRDLPAAELYAVQVGAFQDQNRAEAVRRAAGQKFGPARVVVRQSSPPVYRVLVGEEPSLEQAQGLAARLNDEFRSAFAVRID